MTEIPEHLLKRSKERRAAIGGDDAPASDDAPAAEAAAPAAETAPVPAAAAAVATPEPTPPPPEPVRPEVAAALQRRRIPYWAMPVLAGLPLWAYVFQATLEPPPAPADTPIALGEAAYESTCAACHGATGGGGAGPALTTVTETWPDYRDHAAWVKLGSAGWPADTYGANDKPKLGAMPAHPSLTDVELAQIVLYERVGLGGEDPTSDAALELEAIAHEEPGATFEEKGPGPETEEAGVDPADLTAG
jgi:mono/diheme cytochrome c family protein